MHHDIHPILAESLDGWLFAAGVFFGGLVTAVLALCAIGPAVRRNRRLTLALTSPAIVFGVLATIWIGYGFVTDGLRDPDYSMSDFAIPWSVMAGPPLAASFLAIAVLWVRLRAAEA
jgi:hypothetical protein